MSSNVSGPSESDGVVSDAIKSQAEKIARLLPGLPHPAERAILEEHFHNYSRETFDRVLEELGAADTPVHEWKFAYVAFCRAIDDCYAAEALLSQGNSQEVNRPGFRRGRLV